VIAESRLFWIGGHHGYSLSSRLVSEVWLVRHRISSTASYRWLWNLFFNSFWERASLCSPDWSWTVNPPPLPLSAGIPSTHQHTQHCLFWCKIFSTIFLSFRDLTAILEWHEKLCLLFYLMQSSLFLVYYLHFREKPHLIMSSDYLSIAPITKRTKCLTPQ
jgi:hypothetical protein